MRSLYRAGAESMGAMMFDKQFSRADQIVDKAAGAVQGVKSALIVNAVVTGVSTSILVVSALRMRRRAIRG